jgi:biopolymer transport protein ExbD
MQFRKREEEDYSIPLTSLIDVVFLLLIFFMVSTVFIDFSRKIEIELPESKTSDSSTNIKNIEIDMDVNNKIYLNGEIITEEELEPRLTKLSTGSSSKTVIIKADRRLNYGSVIKVMGICKGAKLKDIGVTVK